MTATTAVAASDLVPPCRTLALREHELQAWLEAAEPGERVEYHRGCLTLDRMRGFSPFGEKRRLELDAVADRIAALAAEGRLLLVQERHGPGDSSYFAIKAKRPSRRGER